MNVLRKILQILISLFILLAGVGLMMLLIKKGPKVAPNPPQVIKPLVEVHLVQLVNEKVVLSADGQVRAQRESDLTAEVGGKVLSLHPRFEVGEVFEEGEILVTVEDADYRTVVANVESQVAEAKLQRSLEQARAEQAIRDWNSISSQKKPNELVLRKPQLEAAQARLKAVEAQLEKAKRDLNRTEIKAPYPCRITSTSIDVGSQIAPGSVLSQLISVGATEVRALLTQEDAALLKEKEGKVSGAVKAFSLEGNHHWKGDLVRSEGIIDLKSNSIPVLISFTGESAPPVGMYVRLEIEGITLEKATVIPRLALKGDQVFVVENSALKKKKVTVTRRFKDSVLITKGLSSGDQILVTSLSTPIEGMEVEVKQAP